MKIQISIIHALKALCFICVLAGCGQKGDLTLSDQKKQSQKSEPASEKAEPIERAEVVNPNQAGD